MVDVISSDEVILEHGGPLTQYDWCPYKKRRDTNTDTLGEHHVTTEVEIGVMCKPRNAKDCQQPQNLRERHGTGSSLKVFREHGPDNTLIWNF